MVAPLIGRAVGSALAKRGSGAVGKAAPRRGEKFMGNVDEVPAKRLADENIYAGSRSVVPTPAARDKNALLQGAALGALAIGGGAAMMSGKKEKEEAKKPSAASRATGRVRPDETPKAAEKSATRREFEREFLRARDTGRATFTFNGKTYTSRLDTESADAHKQKMEKARKLVEASAPRPLAKGGAVTKRKK
jgi:hypothetical protein